MEGPEFQILKTIPFHKVDIKVIDMEIHKKQIFPGSFEQVKSYMDTQGYEMNSIIRGMDAVFVKKGYLDELHEL